MSNTKIAVVKFNMSYDFVCELYNLATEAAHTTPAPQQLCKKLRVRYDDLKPMREQFDVNFAILVAASEQEQKKSIESRFSEFYEKYYTIQTIWADLNELDFKTNSAPVIQETVSKSSSELTRVNLPKITLTHFKGILTEWPSFKSIFDSLIHQNNEISNVQKFHYLLSVLEQEPLSLVKHLSITSENYGVAYNLLQERYENKRVIADKHLELLFSATCPNLKNLKRFIQTMKENTQALNTLGFNVNSWSFLLYHIISKKLPLDLKIKFEFTLQPNEVPDFNNFLAYLEHHSKVLEVTNFTHTSSNNSKSQSTHTSTLHVTNASCYYCNRDHAIYQCLDFEKLKDKKSFLTKKGLCFNCLRPHYISQCFSKRSCQLCKGRHHTKLHNDFAKSVKSSANPDCGEPSSSRQVLLNIEPLSTGLLGTALVGVQDVDGQVHVVRALVDPGAQSSLITESLAQQLRLRRRKACDLFGVGEHRQTTYGKVDCSIVSLTDDSVPGLSTEAIILKRITGYQPAAMVNPIVPEKCSDLQLADKTFNTPGKIDLLLGVNLFSDIFNGPMLKLGNGLPTAHSTIFGWVIMGTAPVVTTSTQYQNISLLTNESRLELTLSKFWESEESPLPAIPDPEDITCERHFVNTHSRDPDGRFIVRLPFKVESSQLGDTRLAALKRFHNLERKLLKEPSLHELYIQFMKDYVESGHMQLVSANSNNNVNRYYIPHHGVLKESSSTTKLRAVFDASLPSSTGVSLNQILMSGPKLQENIQDIILRFRTYLVVFTCDIKQMYRMIKIHDDDRRFQTIFWRESQDHPLQEYELTTVTYGVTSSAYQAIRVLHELAKLNDSAYPEVARVLREDTFVDDIVTGCDTLNGAKILQHQLAGVLAQGHFHLRKWSSNSSELLKDLPVAHRETPYRFEDSGDNIFKILGIEWNPTSDNFLYHVSSMSETLTKRGVLSNIARLYDPCGFITPVTFFAKSFMQKLWLLELGWDDALPPDVQQTWLKFVDDFKSLNQIRIPRLVMRDLNARYQLHGFSDASELGYAACVYLRCDDGESVDVYLLAAKSRVASVKQKQTIPKLELCGAVLLARLMAHVCKVLHSKLKSTSLTAWCDSSIVLTWLRTPPHKLQTFEGNRVSQVQCIIPNATWLHVPSHLNPADCASRGLLPRELLSHQLWWSPAWLKLDPSSWPSACQLLDLFDLPGVKSGPVAAHVVQTVDLTGSMNFTSPVSASAVDTVETATKTHSALAVAASSDEFVQHVIAEYSSFSKLIRVVAWCLRYLHNLRSPKRNLSTNLSLPELKSALLTCIKSVQSSAFADTIKSLRQSKALQGSLRRLNPFLDEQGFLRVGGRLINSDLPFHSKHPLLLPHSHHLTHLLIDHYHQLYGHPGPSILMSILLSKYWILSARRTVRHRIFQCLRCYRLKVKPLNPFMGNLPASRVTQARPFSKVGIDFAGPFNVKDSNARKPKIFKAYLCVFICFATKAMHLEVVSNLSTEAFLACLDRFVSRRGLPTDIFSDCGTNFLGARNHLKDIYLLKSQLDRDCDKIQSYLITREIQWHLNVPSGPHLGGLWENAVKAGKTLLKRIIGERVLTFEELSTVFCKIESILNSRPICPISSDPNDLDALTPGHFLIGQPLLGLPEHDLEQISTHRLNRWQMLQQISQHFWRRWHREYLHTLQQRDRWLKPEQNLQLGDLVLLMEPNTPPLLWKKARVTRLYPGNDGIVRVVEIKTAKGVFMRPVVKLCRLLPEN